MERCTPVEGVIHNRCPAAPLYDCDNLVVTGTSRAARLEWRTGLAHHPGRPAGVRRAVSNAHRDQGAGRVLGGCARSCRDGRRQVYHSGVRFDSLFAVIVGAGFVLVTLGLAPLAGTEATIAVVAGVGMIVGALVLARRRAPSVSVRPLIKAGRDARIHLDDVDSIGYDGVDVGDRSDVKGKRWRLRK